MARTGAFRPGRRVGTAAVMAAIMVAVIGGVWPLSPAPPASATHSSWGHPSNGGYFSSSIVCSGTGTVDISISAAVQTGATGGQYIAYQYYLAVDGYGGSWSSWYWRWVPYNDYWQSNLWDHRFSDVANGNYHMYTRISWWDGASWSPAQGQWAARGQAGYYFVNWSGHCTVQR